MARFVLDPNRLNFNVERRGKEYNLRILQRAQTIFTNLLNLLPSSYISAIAGPNYTLELKAIAVELSKIEIALEDVDTDRSFEHTRSEFLQSIVGYLLFLNGRIPPLDYDDEEFRRFFLSLIKIYFQGSIPASIRDAVALFISEDFQVWENYLLVRAGASGLDISDQFGFQVNILTTNTFPPDLFDIDSAMRIIIDLVRPAHTLYRIRYIFTDTYEPNQPENKVLDAMRWRMASYYYEEFRIYCGGIRDRDRLGHKVNQPVVDEDHSADF
jgi:hypothetical protein